MPYDDGHVPRNHTWVVFMAVKDQRCPSQCLHRCTDRQCVEIVAVNHAGHEGRVANVQILARKGDLRLLNVESLPYSDRAKDTREILEFSSLDSIDMAESLVLALVNRMVEKTHMGVHVFFVPTTCHESRLRRPPLLMQSFQNCPDEPDILSSDNLPAVSCRDVHLASYRDVLILFW